MKERPILFSAPMVRAILAGTKTQTRRVVKKPPHYDQPTNRWIVPAGKYGGHQVNTEREAFALLPVFSPYGRPGDRLWVREAWRVDRDFDDIAPRDVRPRFTAVGYEAGATALKLENPGRLRASMHMPRWASRITLEITGVRVERLQDTSKADAIAEGIEQVDELNGAALWRKYGREPWNTIDPVHSYQTLWEQINGSDSWDENPLVWVVSFRRV